MRRRSRTTASGAVPVMRLSPLFRAIAFLIVLGLLYSWTRNPQNWRWMASDADTAAASEEPPSRQHAGSPTGNAADGAAGSPAGPATGEPAETIVPGPTDQEESEADSARNLFGAVSDRTPLAEIEMPAYWRCLKWARAQSFAELERRADKHILFTRFWEEPDKYRGKPIRLRLHVRRIVEWDAPKNSPGVRRVYEVWGWTDESKSFPYLVVLGELPEGMPVGDNLHREGIFVGYFLKTMAYTAYNKNRSSPLLLGRMKWLASTPPAAPLVAERDWFWIGAVGSH